MKKYLLALALLGVQLAQAQYTPDTSEEKSERKDQFKQAVNFCPIALAFGIYSMNYERLFANRHGVMIRADYEDIPDRMSPSGINVNAKAAILNYRYHLCGGMNSLFVGAFGRYRVFDGDAVANEQAFDFSISEVTVGANLGRRFVFNSGFNITLNAGYGYFMDQQTSTNSSAEAASRIEDFKDSYDLYGGFFGEVSIGYAF